MRNDSVLLTVFDVLFNTKYFLMWCTWSDVNFVQKRLLRWQ